MKAKLLCPFGQRSDLLLAIPRFVVFVSFIDVLLTVFDEPVEQTSKLAGHGRDRFGSAQTGAQAAVLRAQVALAADQCAGRVAERRGGAVDHFARAPFQDFATALLVGGNQPQPTGEPLLTGKGAQVCPAFGNYRLRRQGIEAVN